MLKLEFFTFPARFRMRVTHGSASRDGTENVICAASLDGTTGWGEGCPRSYVTGETVASAVAFFAAHRESLQRRATSLDALVDWMAAHEPEIASNPAAFAAVELALLDLFARQAGQGIEALLRLPPPRAVRISAVFGVTSRGKTRALAAGYRLFGMTEAKVKLSGNLAADRKRLRTIRRWLGGDARLRADANNLFQTRAHCIAHMTGLNLPVWAIEEPLPARDFEGMRAVTQTTGARIILDESATGLADLAEVQGPGWIVNLRVSKLGGLLRSLAALRMARARGLGVIVGCHVGETSLLTRAALALAAEAGHAVAAVECAYGGYLLAGDLTRPGLRFGRGGVVRPPRGPGLGLDVRRERLVPLSEPRTPGP